MPAMRGCDQNGWANTPLGRTPRALRHRRRALACLCMTKSRLHPEPLPSKESQTDAAITEGTRRSMRANRAKNTRPEVAVRRLLHRLGYRFRLHDRTLPGTPDLVFSKRRAVVQVHGCFWHQHPGCQHATMPRARADYWGPKLARNAARDQANAVRLGALGWRLEIVWECELRDEAALAARLARFLGPPKVDG